MTLRLYIPLDAAALAVGADEVAAGIKAAAARRNVAVDIIRTGSRGLYWLEPMVEAETPAGRVAYGPVAPADAAGLLTAGFSPTARTRCGSGRPRTSPGSNARRG